MAIYKNESGQKIFVEAYNTSTGARVTGDAANITAELSIDGGTSAATNDANPTEVDATDHAGLYAFDMTQAETNGEQLIVSAVSATSNVQIDKVIATTTTRGLSAADVNAEVDTALADAGLDTLTDGLFVVDTTIATLASQTSFTLTAGPADDDALVGCPIHVQDASSSVQRAIGYVSAYEGSSKTVTLQEDPGIYTMAVSDKVRVIALPGLNPRYVAKVDHVIDAGGSGKDEWTVQWYQDLVPVAIVDDATNTLTVKTRAASPATLFSTQLTVVSGVDGAAFLDTATQITPGDSVIAIASATIGGAVRTWPALIYGRDTEA